MINWKLFYKIVGSLLFVETTMMFWCLLVSLIYQQDDAPAFIISIIITLFCGFVFRFMGLNAINNMTRRDAYLVVTVVWILFCIFATLPFLISGYISSFTDAFFEMMSGFTTTGATILDDVEHIPHGLLFWRSMTHWIGGLGIVFFTIAVLPSMVGGSVKVFSAEATGPIKTKLHPRLSTCAKWIWIVYLVLTVSCAGSYYVAGMNFFDSVNYAMATTATGGFSTHNTSISFFNSPAIEYVATLFCFLSGMNFTLLYTSIIKLHFRDLLHNSELNFYASVVAMFTLFIMVELII
jgi:trk system potassium uptake protein TrkH